MKKIYFSLLFLSITLTINAQIVTIPDANFKAILLANTLINSNGDNEIQVTEAEAYNSGLNVNNANIADLTGIEAFVNLQQLSCNQNQLTALDVTANTKLTSLSLFGNNVASLDVSQLIELTFLDVGFNELISLDISNNTKITSLRCSFNELTSLNLANGNNALMSIDLSSNFELYCAKVDNVNIATNAAWGRDDILGYSEEDCSTKTSIVLTAFNGSVNINPSSLGNLYTIGSSITLTATPATDYEFRSWYGDSNETINPLTITLNEFTRIEALFSRINDPIVNIPDTNFKNALLNHNVNIDTNRDGEIQVSEAEAYNGELIINNNNISDLTGIEAFTNIITLSFENNNVTNVDLSQNTELKNLNCFNNKINSLDLNNNIELTNLRAYSNLITGIDISNCDKLSVIDLRNNLLNTINTNAQADLFLLDLGSNNLSSIDLTQNTKLQFLSLGQNQNLSTLDVSNTPLLRRLEIRGTGIAAVDISMLLDLDDLDISRTPITTINIDANTKLTKFEAQIMNDLENISFINNVLLERVTVSSSKISEFDLSSNPNLDDLFLSGGNVLTRINIANGNNANISRFYSNPNSNITCIQIDSGFTPPSSWVKSAAASFSDNCTQYTVNLTSTNGKIDTNPDRNTLVFEEDLEVILTATPDPGYQFDGWSGDATGNTNPLTITMDADKTITAIFSKIQHTLTTNATNGTITRNPVTPTSGTYDFGTEVELTATPNAGYQFDGWSGDATGNTNPLTITMDADKTITALFSKIQHTLTTNATNGTITRNPITPTSGTYDFGTDVELTATPNAGYQFDGWSGDATGNTNPLTITMDADKTITAIFSKIQHTLTTNATNGTITRNPVTPTSGTYDFGTEVELTATPNAGYQFDGWSGDATGNTNLLTITMDADKTVTAIFSKIQHTLTTNATNGTITRNPVTPTSGTYDFGTDVELTATPNAGYQFDGWSGDATGNTNPLTITMDTDKNITALFSKIQHTLTTNATDGTITRNPVTPTSGTYDFGTEVELTATPNAGYQFDGWSDDATGNTNPLTITMDADKTITALFSKTSNLDIEIFATGFTSLEGIGINSNNEVFVSEYNSGKIFKIDTNGNSTEFASSGFRLNDISFDKNNQLFVAQGFIDDILISDTTGNLSEYVDAFNKKPNGLTFYDNALYYTSDFGDVYKVDSNKNVTVFANGFFASAGIDFDSNGNAYIADRSDRKLFKVTQSGIKTEITGGSKIIYGVAVVNDIVYYTSGNKIIKYNPTDNTSEDYVTTDLNEPGHLEVDLLGNMYIVNRGNGTIVKVFDENLKSTTASINDEEFNNQIVLYPNPVRDYLTIRSKDFSDIQKVTVVNSIGKEIITTKKTNDIDVTTLAKGLYLIKIKATNNRVAIKKFIKE
ncbi:InlB B-repeat-containing protein [Tenacibaculum jejuense]|uniref:Secretion system C-terminal sorting domain-containing protein n=1 Tax=Tenacibaculum jejuense TaxID=584609 RepID=A0A238UAD6_9FLAO|nr:InlB B-repeat-containing protein [Tenacibaculum jejuense]SNR15434.1 Protein of unknown function precursor containing a C-terminal secretion signal [Tenacibaculum jejuense]